MSSIPSVSSVRAPPPAAFEVINASQVASVSVGLHPKVKKQLADRMARAKKEYGGEGKEAS